MTRWRRLLPSAFPDEIRCPGPERRRDGHATVLGAVAGLVIITPCAGYVSSYSALPTGAIGGLACHWAMKIKTMLRLDDALDVIAVHLVGGALGVLLLGFSASGRSTRLARTACFTVAGSACSATR